MKKIIVFAGAATAVAGMAFAGNTLAYQSNTGAGSTTVPSADYQRRLAAQQQQRNTFYYQPAPARAPTPPQSQFMAHPSGIPGFAPVPYQLSPRAAQVIGDGFVKQMPACVKGGISGAGGGFWYGGPSGAARGAVGGCFGNMITN